MFFFNVFSSLLCPFLGVFLQAITLRHITGRMEVQSPVLTTLRYSDIQELLTFMVQWCTAVKSDRCFWWGGKSVDDESMLNLSEIDSLF